MEHPQSLAAAGKATRVQPFARSVPCALTTPEFALQGKSLAQRLLDADVKVGTSAPGSVPVRRYCFGLATCWSNSSGLPSGSVITKCAGPCVVSSADTAIVMPCAFRPR